MLFSSYAFIVIFLPAVVLGYYALALLGGRTAALTFLVLASFAFYASWNAAYLALLLASIGFNYLIARRLTSDEPHRRRWLIAGIVANLALLGYYKYAAFFLDIVAPGYTIEAIVLPLGISFFTFECVSYLLDVYRGAAQLTPLRRFLLFPAFFPHMVAGPILRLKEFAPQLDKLRTPTLAESLQAIDRILLGWVKKLVLANTLAGIVDQGFSNGAVANSAVDNWLVAIAFGLQIYFDFSAYSDIAIGSAKLFGIDFPENFNSPYHSRSPSEFWTRWHMTLSRWIRDYLFFPLNLWAGRRLWLRYALLVAVMSLVGLWHGAGLCFVLWGTWHGMLMVCHRLLDKRVGWLPDSAQRAIGLTLTFLSVQAGWVLFRSPSVAQAWLMLSSMATPRSLTLSFGINDCLLVVASLTAYFVLDPFVRRLVTRDPNAVNYAKWSFWARPAIYAVAVQSIFMFDRSNVAFIYFQF